MINILYLFEESLDFYLPHKASDFSTSYISIAKIQRKIQKLKKKRIFKLKKEGFLSLELLIEEFWSGKRDSNPRPLPWQGNALPAELFPQQCVFKVAVSFFLSTMSLFF